jgi:hypothetical protein
MVDTELYRALGNIEGEVRSMHEKLDRTLQQHDALEVRVSKLEKWQWKIVGGVTVISVVVPVIIQLVHHG